MKLYFAYGPNMAASVMRRNFPHAVRVGIAVLKEHALFINTHGLPGIRPVNESSVHGVLWAIIESEEMALDYYEGVQEGLYRKQDLAVHPEKGQITDALVYMPCDQECGDDADHDLLEQIIHGATSNALPKTYIQYLRNLFGLDAENLRDRRRLCEYVESSPVNGAEQCHATGPSTTRLFFQCRDRIDL